MSINDESNSSTQTENQQVNHSEQTIKKPPKSWKQRLAWLGPGLTWMAAGAGGAGELLFPPRVGSLYGYTLLWAAVAAVFLKWFINHEIGRLAVCTGATILDAFKQVPGPRNWAVWLIVLPQLVVSVTAIAGLAASAATALILVLPGNTSLWMAVILLSTMVFLLWGKYSKLELVAKILAIALAITAVVTAVTVFPSFDTLVAGLAPQIPQNVNYQEVVPWLSFVLAGAAGMTWYSYWVVEKGYGVGKVSDRPGEMLHPEDLSSQEKKYLRGWITEMTIDITIGVLGGLFIVIAFLILGAELLRPEGIVPAEDRVAEVLGQLLGNVWGQIGFWFMIVAVFFGFLQTTLTNQDGWGRLLADGTNIILRSFGVGGRWSNEEFLRKVYIVVLLTIAPSVVYIVVGEPVAILQLAGIIEAIHIPLITWVTLYLNKTLLPRQLQPSKFMFWATVLAGLFYAGFATIYLLQVLGVVASSSGSA
ncbi:MAG: Nramp family divalent metal transporter [Scytonema sp. PMC 1069.18]|nr:Nramp family divalent metal transporter [Scytonema sp. PMC 1069.18]MEC4880302.1 Nramp family divalent metal transporter [Scytonema sp. PMC 1070.18]